MIVTNKKCLYATWNLCSARKPEKVDHIDAAGCIGDVVRAYTALYYQARVCGGETILIFNGASVSILYKGVVFKVTVFKVTVLVLLPLFLTFRHSLRKILYDNHLPKEQSRFSSDLHDKNTF